MTSPRPRFQPDWVLSVNRIIPILQESTFEAQNVTVHELANPAASTNTPTIIVPSPDIESTSRPVVAERNDDIESLKRSISLDHS